MIFFTVLRFRMSGSLKIAGETILKFRHKHFIVCYNWMPIDRDGSGIVCLGTMGKEGKKLASDK